MSSSEREARRRRQGKSTRAPSKTVSLPDGIVEDLEAELEAFQGQMLRWQKFLSNEDAILFWRKLRKIVDDRLIDRSSIFADRAALSGDDNDGPRMIRATILTDSGRSRISRE